LDPLPVPSYFHHQTWTVVALTEVGFPGEEGQGHLHETTTRLPSSELERPSLLASKAHLQLEAVWAKVVPASC